MSSFKSTSFPVTSGVFHLLVFLLTVGPLCGAEERSLLSSDTCGTTFGRDKPCQTVDTPLVIAAGSYTYLTIKPNAGAFLNYSFVVVDPPDSHTAALLLNEKDFKLFESGGLDITAVTTPGSVQSTEAAGNITAQFIAGNNGASNEQLETYYLVFNDADVLNITLSYTLEYTPNNIQTCFASIMTVIAGGLVPVLVFFLCMWRESRKKGAKGMGEYMSESSTITYKYVEPKGFSNKCGTVPFLKKKPYGFWVYWANCDDIFWICYPEVHETLNRTQRCMASVTFIFVQLLFQTNWNRLVNIQSEPQSYLVSDISKHDSYVGKNSSLYTGELLLQVFSLMIVGALFALLYKPFLRCLARPDHKSALGKILNNLGVAIFLIVFLSVLISIGTLLQSHTCSDFLWAIFFPFFLAFLFRSVFPGVLMRYLFFKLSNTFGKDVRVEPHHGHFADSERGEDEEVRSSLLGSD